MALGTEIEESQGKLSSANVTTSGRDTTHNTQGLNRTHLQKTQIEKWRITKRGDEKAPTVCDGRSFWWYKWNKIKDGHWDAMYIHHKEEDHDKAVAKYKIKKPKTDDDEKNQKSSNVNTSKLVGGKRLKEVLFSCLLIGDLPPGDVSAGFC